MSEDKRIEKSTDDRVGLLIDMLDIGSISRSDPDRMVGTADFAHVAIEALTRKFPSSSVFYTNADELRIQSAASAKNEFTDPFLIAARIGYAYAFAIVREWQSMTDKPAIETISEGPSDGSCQG